MTNKWARLTLADVCDVYQPETITQKQMCDSGEYPVFGANGRIGSYSAYNHEDSELVLGCRGSVGAVHITPPRSWITGNAMVVRPKPHVATREFLAYALRGGITLEDAISGTAQPQITRKSLMPIAICLPCDLPEQQRIVAILDEAFDAIASAKANTEKNLRSARALFDSYVHSVFGERGPTWIETTLDRLATNLDSKRVPITKSARKRGDYPYYGASGIVDHVADFIFDDDILLISEDGANLLARSTPIAFSVSGKCWVNNHAHILKFAHMATQRYVEFYLESVKLDDYITGAAQPKLNQKALNSIPIPIPKAVEVQARIVEDIETLSAETQHLESISRQRLAALDALKKTLLHHAFAGELSGTSADRIPASARP